MQAVRAPGVPVGRGSVELRVHGGGLHAGPLRGGHQVLLVHAVLQAVWDAACGREGKRRRSGTRPSVQRGYANVVAKRTLWLS